MARQYWVFGAVAWFAGFSGCSHVAGQRLPASPQGAPAELSSGVPAGKLTIPRGYSLLMRHGKYLYCREAVPTGSVLRKEVCLTADEMNKEQSATRYILDARSRAQCGSVKCVFR